MFLYDGCQQRSKKEVHEMHKSRLSDEHRRRSVPVCNTSTPAYNYSFHLRQSMGGAGAFAFDHPYGARSHLAGGSPAPLPAGEQSLHDAAVKILRLAKKAPGPTYNKLFGSAGHISKSEDADIEGRTTNSSKFLKCDVEEGIRKLRSESSDIERRDARVLIPASQASSHVGLDRTLVETGSDPTSEALQYANAVLILIEQWDDAVETAEKAEEEARQKAFRLYGLSDCTTDDFSEYATICDLKKFVMRENLHADSNHAVPLDVKNHAKKVYAFNPSSKPAQSTNSYDRLLGSEGLISQREAHRTRMTHNFKKFSIGAVEEAVKQLEAGENKSHRFLPIDLENARAILTVFRTWQELDRRRDEADIRARQREALAQALNPKGDSDGGCEGGY